MDATSDSSVSQSSHSSGILEPSYSAYVFDAALSQFKREKETARTGPQRRQFELKAVMNTDPAASTYALPKPLVPCFAS